MHKERPFFDNEDFCRGEVMWHHANPPRTKNLAPFFPSSSLFLVAHLHPILQACIFIVPAMRLGPPDLRGAGTVPLAAHAGGRQGSCRGQPPQRLVTAAAEAVSGAARLTHGGSHSYRDGKVRTQQTRAMGTHFRQEQRVALVAFK